jgi:rSAM/selenodomain-associated transferase 1
MRVFVIGTGSRSVLGLFAKWPQPGQVKTRLAAATSPDWAARVAEAFLLDLVERLTVVAAQRVLAFAPPAAENEFAHLVGSRFGLRPQTAGDLGRRMANFFSGQLQTGAERVVLLGTDSPTVPLAFIEQAFRELERADVVLGPATDGGYYLIGCARRLPPLFENVSWSSSRVLAQTIAQLTDPSWRLALLPPWYDVDTLDDWWMLQGYLRAQRRAGLDPEVPHTERLTQEPLPVPDH